MNKLYCFHCGTKFYGSRSNQLFCTPRCRYKYYHNGNLILTIKKEWFDMIKNGIKLEEYREIKPCWTKRFGNYFTCIYNTTGKRDVDGNIPKYIWYEESKVIEFRKGYGNNVPSFKAECTITEGYGKEEWGAKPGVKYYVLKIKRIL